MQPRVPLKLNSHRYLHLNLRLRQNPHLHRCSHLEGKGRAGQGRERQGREICPELR